MQLYALHSSTLRVLFLYHGDVGRRGVVELLTAAGLVATDAVIARRKQHTDATDAHLL